MRVFFAIAILAAGVFFAFRFQKPTSSTPVFSPVKALDTIEEKESRSLDGSKKLILRREKQEDGSSKYTLTVINTNDNTERLLLAKTLPDTSSMDLHNSWAPDDLYVFVKEKDADGLHYLVFKTNGEAFANGEQYFDISVLFAEKQPKYQLKDVTGWDGNDTLHVTTAQNSSFWFIVSTRAFLQLAR